MGEHAAERPPHRRPEVAVAALLVTLSLLVPVVLFLAYDLRAAMVSLTIPGGVLTFSFVLLRVYG